MGGRISVLGCSAGTNAALQRLLRVQGRFWVKRSPKIAVQQGGFTGLMFLRYLPRPAALPPSPDGLRVGPSGTKLSIRDATLARD